MNKVILGAILISFPLSAVAGDAPKRTMKSSVRANIREAIPGSQPRQAQQIDYPMPGKLTLNAVQYCGDGDVANFANSHPNWDHQQGGTIQYVFGYWVQGDGEPMYPTPDSYFSTGMGTMAVDGPSLTTMTPATGGAAVEILATTNTTMGLMTQLSGYRMNAVSSSKDEFRVFLAGMMCKTVTSPDTVKHDPVKVSSEMSNLKDRIGSAIHSAVQSASSWADVKSAVTVAITDQADSIKGTVGSGNAIGLGTDDPAKWAQQVFELTKPSASDLDGYKGAMSGNSVLGEVKAFAAEFDSKATCAEVSKVDPAKKYPWEPYALQLTCAAYNKDEPGKLGKLVADLMSPSALPSDADFKAKKLAVAEALAAGSLMQATQIAFRDRNDPVPKQRCFQDPSTVYIEKVMASILFRATPGSPEYTMSHPEGSFAVGEYVNYYGSNEWTIFHMTSPAADSSYGRKIVRGESAATNAIFVPDKVVMKFNVRGVGCGQNVYCWNDRR